MGFFVFFCVLAVILFGVLLATAYLSYLVRHSNHGKGNMKRKKVSVLCVLGSGGHTTEMIGLLTHLGEQYSPRYYMLADTDKMSEDKVREFEQSREQGAFTLTRIPRSREVGQSYISSVVSTVYATYYAFNAVWKANPDLLLVNGPGTCIPVVLSAAFLDMIRLRDTTIIYEESICRVKTLSLSGAILYYSGLADDVVVQWKPLKERYPRSMLISDL